MSLFYKLFRRVYYPNVRILIIFFLLTYNYVVIRKRDLYNIYSLKFRWGYLCGQFLYMLHVYLRECCTLIVEFLILCMSIR